MQTAKCECGAMLVEVGKQGTDELFWLHENIEDAVKDTCGFIEGSEEHVEEAEYKRILEELKAKK